MIDAKQIDIVELKPTDFNRAAQLLAEAFDDNPSHMYIFPNQHKRLELLHWGLKANLKLNLAQPAPIGQSFALVETNRYPETRQVQAMGFWHTPESGSVALVNKLLSGWAIAPFKFGRQTYQRLMEVMDAMEKTKAKVMGTNQAWYLNNMAVAKELRGTGLGTLVLKHQLESVVTPSGFPAILMTQKAGNVRFYQHLGFKVATESIIGSGENAFSNWCMIFPASGL